MIAFVKDINAEIIYVSYIYFLNYIPQSPIISKWHWRPSTLPFRVCYYSNCMKFHATKGCSTVYWTQKAMLLLSFSICSQFVIIELECTCSTIDSFRVNVFLKSDTRLAGWWHIYLSIGGNKCSFIRMVFDVHGRFVQNSLLKNEKPKWRNVKHATSFTCWKKKHFYLHWLDRHLHLETIWCGRTLRW